MNNLHLTAVYAEPLHSKWLSGDGAHQYPWKAQMRTPRRNQVVSELLLKTGQHGLTRWGQYLGADTLPEARDLERSINHRQALHVFLRFNIG